MEGDLGDLDGVAGSAAAAAALEAAGRRRLEEEEEELEAFLPPFFLELEEEAFLPPFFLAMVKRQCRGEEQCRCASSWRSPAWPLPTSNKTLRALTKSNCGERRAASGAAGRRVVKKGAASGER